MSDRNFGVNTSGRKKGKFALGDLTCAVCKRHAGYKAGSSSIVLAHVANRSSELSSAAAELVST